MVYSKPPFDSPARVLAYLARYTHSVAIANHRLVSIDDGRVRFHWRDYRHHNKRKCMTLDACEFMRRFLLHTLPPGFHRIRHFGFLAEPRRQQNLALCRRLLDMPPASPPTDEPTDYRDRFEALTGQSLRRCPACGCETMATVDTIRPGGEPPPPEDTS